MPLLKVPRRVSIGNTQFTPLPRHYSSLRNMTVSRTTLFKLTSDADIEEVLAAYVKLAETNSKDGKPYILSSNAYRLLPDPRSQGYSIAAQTTFASVEDMKYYDEECAAHKELKDIVKPKAAGPPLMVYGETHDMRVQDDTPGCIEIDRYVGKIGYAHIRSPRFDPLVFYLLNIEADQLEEDWRCDL
ncbi:hypothetical protein FKW77_008571 [Venturia effusa]|uniref:Stress-response A/B barrel domain-containing protein n=1 Tax=Venturia effusa TaxID=50376 RepID=A0A517LHY1_9PEZI|nr:hypothetical protein FKW77_008571 [Venturia effusa]